MAGRWGRIAEIPFKSKDRKFKTNIRHDGTTTDGGFPRSVGGIDYYEAKKHIKRDIIICIVICTSLSFILKVLIDMGLGDNVWRVISGQISFSEGRASVVIFSIFVLTIIGLIVTTIITTIRVNNKCNRVFNLESEE